VSTKDDSCQCVMSMLSEEFPGATRADCWRQQDTKDFLIAIEVGGKVGSFRLTNSEYAGPDWRQLLLDRITDWGAANGVV